MAPLLSGPIFRLLGLQPLPSEAACAACGVAHRAASGVIRDEGAVPDGSGAGDRRCLQDRARCLSAADRTLGRVAEFRHRPQHRERPACVTEISIKRHGLRPSHAVSVRARGGAICSNGGQLLRHAHPRSIGSQHSGRPDPGQAGHIARRPRNTHCRSRLSAMAIRDQTDADQCTIRSLS